MSEIHNNKSSPSIYILQVLNEKILYKPIKDINGQTVSLEFTTRDNTVLSKCCKAATNINYNILQLNILQHCTKVIISPFISSLTCTYIFCMATHFKAI